MLKLVPEAGNEGKGDVKNYHVLRKSSCFSKPLASTRFLLLLVLLFYLLGNPYLLDFLNHLRHLFFSPDIYSIKRE